MMTPPEPNARAMRAEDRGWGPRGWARAMLAGAAIAALLVGIYLLSSDARKEIGELATASADARQWTLSQVEVDFLKFQNALLQETARDAPNLENVKRRFDVFYSRISLLNSANVLIAMREDQIIQISVNRLLTFRDETAALMDGPSDVLAASLGDIIEETRRLSSEARKVSLSGVKVYSALAEAQRARVTTALVRLAALTLLLVGLLTAVIFALAWLFRAARQQTRQNIQNQRRLKATVEASLDAIVVADENGTIVDLNAAAEDVFGYSNADMLGRGLSETIIPAAYRAAHEKGMERYRQSGEKKVVGSGRLSLEALHASGRTIPVELSISAAKTREGELFVSYIRDISERLKQEEELLLARDTAVAGEKAKADMMAIMSHEMRTPLNGIIGTLELLGGTKLDTGQSKYLDVIGKSSQLLLDHVNDVLTISRIESGAESRPLKPNDPLEICRDVVESLQGAAEQKGNALSLRAPDTPLGPFLTDRSKLQRVLTNLVGNAVKFTQDGRIDLALGLSEDGAQIIFTVTDTGRGIAKEDHRRIFDEFVTLDPSYSRTNEGTGLGLSIVKRLVEDLQGKIVVASSLGAGSEFKVILPFAPADASADPKRPDPAEQTPAQKPLSVLLVEDDETNRLVASGLLAKLGHTVQEAVDGRDGVALAARRPFDLILMDISMPHLDGVEAARAIRGGGGPNKKTPIAALTAHAMAEDQARFVGAGMSDVLIKPITSARLGALLGRISGQSEPVSAPHLVDRAVHDELRSTLGPGKAQELTEAFARQVEAFFAARPGAAGHTPDADLQMQLHKMIGSAAIFGAARFRTSLEEAAVHLTSKETASFDAAIGAAEKIWEETQADLLPAEAPGRGD